MKSNSSALRKNIKTFKFAIKSKISRKNLFSWTWNSVQFSAFLRTNASSWIPSLKTLPRSHFSLCPGTMASCILLHLLHGTEGQFKPQLQWYTHLYCYFIPSLYSELAMGRGGRRKKRNTFILFILKRKNTFKLHHSSHSSTMSLLTW